jgi:hypothetical protein
MTLTPSPDLSIATPLGGTSIGGQRWNLGCDVAHPVWRWPHRRPILIDTPSFSYAPSESNPSFLKRHGHHPELCRSATTARLEPPKLEGRCTRRASRSSLNLALPRSQTTENFGDFFSRPFLCHPQLCPKFTTAWTYTTAWGPAGLVVDTIGSELSMCNMCTLKAKHYSSGWTNFTAERQFPR